MFPTSLEHPYVPRGRRRGRNDPNSRDFICPCGKSYLSYPALFTHIKIKHNGRAPGQIIKPKTQNPSKRGRPRQKQVYDSQSDTNDIAANCIDRLCDFVTQFEKPDEQMSRKLKDLYMKDPFYKVYVNFNPQEQQPRYNERDDLYDEYCDNVFCEVIVEVNKRINEPCYVDGVIVLLMMMGHFINEQSSGQNIQQQRNENEYGYGQQYHQQQNGQYEQQNEDQGVQQNEYIEQVENVQNEQQQKIVEQQQYDQQQQQQDKQQQKRQQKRQQAKQQSKQQQQLKGQQQQYEKQQQNNKGDEQYNIQNEQYNIQNGYQQQQQQQGVYDNNGQIQQNGQMDIFYKLKQQPIRNIVNYINNFILNYNNKYYQTYQLNNYSFFKQSNIKIFIELLFHWLTMKKYVGYKLKVNKNYK